MASDKKYFPERKRKGKRGRGAETMEPGADGEDATQETNLLDAQPVAAQQSAEDLLGMGAPITPAQQPVASMDDLLGLGAPVAQPAAQAQPSVNDLLGGDIFAPVANQQ